MMEHAEHLSTEYGLFHHLGEVERTHMFHPAPKKKTTISKLGLSSMDLWLHIENVRVIINTHESNPNKKEKKIRVSILSLIVLCFLVLVLT